MIGKLLLRICFGALLVSIHLHGYSQYYNQRPDYLKANSFWAFGTNAGLNFNSGVPTAFTSSVIGYEGFATVADPATGDLLFYTNGHQCWNATHQLMPNGSGLLGNVPLYGMTTTAQGAVVVPVIDSPGKYYLFSLPNSDAASFGLYYSVVDMALDNGNGDIDPTRKNILLDTDTLTEGMIAIPGNNCDIWLMVHAYMKPEFKAYRIHAGGVDPVPVISNTGGSFQESTFRPGYLGTMAISSDRNKIAITSYLGDHSYIAHCGVWLGDFDATTGQVSNAIKIIEQFAAFSAIFSPDNSKLYVNMAPLWEIYTDLYQYDVSVEDSATIANSRTFIATLDYANYLKLYNDTIYVSAFGKSHIHRINQPNNPAASCGFQTNAIALEFLTFSQMGLPSDNVFPLSDTFYTHTDTFFCSGSSGGLILNTLNDGNDFSWSTGATTRTISADQPGDYWVIYRNSCFTYVDTFSVTQITLFTQIDVSGYTLTATGGPFVQYQWYRDNERIDGATTDSFVVDDNGNYTVEVTDINGCSFMSAVYRVNNYSVGHYHAGSRMIRIYPNPAGDFIRVEHSDVLTVTLSDLQGRNLRTSNTGVEISLKGLSKGIYLLRIMDQQGQWIRTEKIIKQ